jgi:hypothetical protein
MTYIHTYIQQEAGRLAKPRIVKSVAFKGPDVTVAEDLDTIARRDGTNFSNLVVDLGSKYVQAHKDANDVVPLNKFVEHPGMVALPTMGEPLTLARLDKLSDEDFALLEKACEARHQEIAFARKWRDDKWRRTA